MQQICDENSFASRLESDMMPNTSCLSGMPAVICRKEKETAGDRQGGFPLQTLPSLVQPTVVFLGIVVLMRENGGGEISYGETKGCSVCDCKDSAGLARPITLGIECPTMESALSALSDLP